MSSIRQCEIVSQVNNNKWLIWGLRMKQACWPKSSSYKEILWIEIIDEIWMLKSQVLESLSASKLLTKNIWLITRKGVTNKGKGNYQQLRCKLRKPDMLVNFEHTIGIEFKNLCVRSILVNPLQEIHVSYSGLSRNSIWIRNYCEYDIMRVWLCIINLSFEFRGASRW